MALNPRYVRYLVHFGSTVAVRELAAAPKDADLVALRHDVDYNIDVALEMAYWEHRSGFRATYFILHTAPYYQADDQLLEKCLQLQELGHEVALHTNFLAEWYRGNIDSVGKELKRELSRLRSAGLQISGATAHGDALCYEAGFTNYWLFKELKPDHPRDAERRVTAEGTKARDVDRAISYPEDGDEIVRPDGARFPLWSLRLSDFDLEYEASRLNPDHYFSDSGGTWKRTPDPITHTFGKGRSLVLMHPIHWRPEQRHFYILSTARSGSKWLAGFLDKATSLTARHEFTLNYDFSDGAPIPHKRTATGFTDLVAKREEASRLIQEARAWSENLQTDYAEANVYLEQFLDIMPRDPFTVCIHLYRNPKAVVRSIIQRDWYSVPYDDRHTAVDVEGWEVMSQLEKACWYVCDVNKRLADFCSVSIRFEDMVSDPEYLSNILDTMGVAVYPRLAKQAWKTVVNATPSWNVPEFDSWSPADQETFLSICGPICRDIGYLTEAERGRVPAEPRLRNRVAKKHAPIGGEDFLTLFDEGCLNAAGGPTFWGCAPATHGGSNHLAFQSGIKGYVLLGGGYWKPSVETPSALRQYLNREYNGCLSYYAGWRNERDYVYVINLEAEFDGHRGSLRIFCISYNEDGDVVARQNIDTLSGSWPTLARYFRPKRNAITFNIALFKAADEDAVAVRFNRCRIIRARDVSGVPLEHDVTVAKAPIRPYEAVDVATSLRVPEVRSLIDDSSQLPESFGICAADGEHSIPGYSLLSRGAQLHVRRNETQVRPLWLTKWLAKFSIEDTCLKSKFWPVAQLKALIGMIEVGELAVGEAVSILAIQKSKNRRRNSKTVVARVTPEQPTATFRVPIFPLASEIAITLMTSSRRSSFVVKRAIIKAMPTRATTQSLS